MAANLMNKLHVSRLVSLNTNDNDIDEEWRTSIATKTHFCSANQPHFIIIIINVIIPKNAFNRHVIV